MTEDVRQETLLTKAARNGHAPIVAAILEIHNALVLKADGAGIAAH